MTEFEIGYVAGLIDGEGSVSLSRRNKGKWRSPVVRISNNQRSILQFALDATGLVGCMVKKLAKQPTHQVNYDLQFTNNAALRVCAAVVARLRHPVKKARMLLLLEQYKALTVRNGKYTPAQAMRKVAFEQLFFSLE